jgi:serine/threonine protein kinase/Tfp pilus assembly protein PilF
MTAPVMKPERWQLIEHMYHAAMESGPDRRASFLAEACGGDDALRREVEKLIIANERAGGFLATPALELEAKNLAADNSGTSIGFRAGQELSHYTIISRIGAGGMGEVLLARDRVLERLVALKLLPVEFTQNTERLQRFVREAKSASGLNHPNIITIYEIGEVATELGNTHFIATEFIDGQTLRTWTPDPETRLGQILNIAIQVASALDAAHKAGIVHRDIKPENLMVRPDGLVKVLDFGLAKLTAQGRDTLDSKVPTLVEGMKTKPGIILGTLRYMSPEQARGNIVDRRSDIFSLGVVMHELLTGRPLFAGDTDADVVAAIIRKEAPPLAECLPDISPDLEFVIQKALAKDADLRYQSAAELREALSNLDGLLLSAVSVPIKPPRFETLGARSRIATVVTSVLRRTRLSLSLAGVIVVAVLGVAASLLWFRPAPHQPSSMALGWYDKGTRSLRDGGYYEASKRLERAIQADDKFALAHARLAEAWTELDYSDKARNEILRARSLVGDLSAVPRLEGLYLRAITHVVLREFAPAIESYQQITREAPEADMAQAYLDLGRAYEKNDEINNAIGSYLEARTRAPSEAAAFLRLGILYGRTQDLKSAEASFQQAQDIYRGESNEEGVTEVFYQRGRLLLDLRKHSEARSSLESALKITTATDNHYQQVRAMLALSSVSAKEGNAKQAEDEARNAIALAQNSGIENQATGGLIWLGNAFSGSGEYSKAEKYYSQALDLARRNNGRENEAWARFQLGALRQLQHKTEEALSLLEQALTFYRDGGYREKLSKTLMAKARIDRDKGDHESAARTFTESLKVAEELGDQAQMVLSHDGIGNVLVRRELYPQALAHFDQSYEISKSLKDRVFVGYTGINQASILWQIGAYDKAKVALDEVSSLANRPEGANKALLAYVYMINGGLELSLQNLVDSKKKSQQALSLAGKESSDIAIQARCTLGLAHARSGGPRVGQALCKEAVDLATATGDPQLLSSALLALAESTLGIGDAQHALETTLQAREIFSRFAMSESEWRALLLAARASRHPSEQEIRRKYASNADAMLSTLEQKWGSEFYNGYVARPDIQRSLGQLRQMLKP